MLAHCPNSEPPCVRTEPSFVNIILNSTDKIYTRVKLLVHLNNCLYIQIRSIKNSYQTGTLSADLSSWLLENCSFENPHVRTDIFPMPDFTRRIYSSLLMSLLTTIPLKYSHSSLHAETQRFQRAALARIKLRYITNSIE